MSVRHARSVPLWWGMVLAGSAAACAAGSSVPAFPGDGGSKDAGQDGMVVPDGSQGTGGFAAGSGGASGTGGRTATGGAGGGSAGAGGPDGGSGMGGAGGGVGGCAFDLALIAPQTEDTLTSGSNARVRLRAALLRVGSRTPTWTWTVRYLETATLDSVSARVVSDPNTLTSTADFPVVQPGNYLVSVTVDSGTSCTKSKYLLVKLPDSASYAFRVTPPASLSLEIPVQDTPVSLLDRSRQGETVSIMLVRGARRSLSLQAPDDTFLPGYVRVSSVPAGVRMEGHTIRGPLDVFMLPTLTYDVLIVPDGDLAPLLLSAPAESFTSAFSRIRIDQGTLVTGSVRDSAGAPVANARIALRHGVRPSTIGVSDRAGNFSLWARPGVLSAVVIPPDVAGLPEARVSEIPGIPLDGNGTTLHMTWSEFKRGPFSVSVKTSDGMSPVAGSLVRVESEENLRRPAGILRVAGSQPIALTAIGVIRLDAVTDAAGVAAFPDLPVDDAYKITVVPPPALPAAAVTTRYVTLTSAGLTQIIPLARPLVLTGALLPRGVTKGVRIIARDQSIGITSAVASAVVREDGGYSLPLAPGRLYRLVADPPAGGFSLARTILGSKNLDSADGTALDYTAAAAFRFNGIVRVDDSEERAIAGAVVQVFCVGLPPACEDSEFALAETITSETGTFTVALPAPRSVR